MSVRELKRFCENQILKGNGDKKILISQDDEGNGYHELFYQFNELSEDEVIDMQNNCEIPDLSGEPSEYIILG